MPKSSEEVAFTKAGISSLAGRQGERLVVHDTRVKGLRAELREGGSVTFYVFKRLPGGGPVRVTLGKWPDLTVDTARKLAQEKIGDIAKGLNPAAANRRRREEATVGELWKHFLKQHAKPHKKSWKDDERQWNSYLSHLKNRKLSHVTKADVQSLHAKLGEKHGKYTANRALALLATMFGKADELGYDGANPTRGIKKFKEQSRDRFIQPEELPRFFAAVGAEPNKSMRDFFLLALFTGARKSNLCAMRWNEIDLGRGEWRIPDTKAGRPQIVYLSEPALRILEGRQEEVGDSEWVFPGVGKTGHITQVKVAWGKIRTAAGIPDVRVHDLRRTLGSYQAISGASLAIIGASLGHSQAKTTQVYARLTSNAVSESVQTAAAAITAAAKINETEAATEGQGDE